MQNTCFSCHLVLRPSTLPFSEHLSTLHIFSCPCVYFFNKTYHLHVCFHHACSTSPPAATWLTVGRRLQVFISWRCSRRFFKTIWTLRLSQIHFPHCSWYRRFVFRKRELHIKNRKTVMVIPKNMKICEIYTMFANTTNFLKTMFLRFRALSQALYDVLNSIWILVCPTL